MLNNMFNIFDPYTMNLPLNYYFMILFFLNYNKFNFWMNNLNFKIFFLNKFNKEIWINNPIMNKTMINMFSSMMMFLFILNLNNLFPNLFYISSNMMYSINLSFFFINIYFIFNFYNNLNIFFMNMTPKNTPLYLIILINLIELNSFFIQILTLSLRLMINMMLGHIIMMLINNIILIWFYLIIEMIIIIIQSYVFFILNLLNSNNMY